MSNENEPFDLGSDPPEDFDPFASEEELVADDVENTVALSIEEPTVKQNPQAEIVAPSSMPEQDKTTPNSNNGSKGDGAEVENPLLNAIDKAETKGAEKVAQSLYEKFPVFDYAGATEDIEDTSQTFEDLRIAKAADFPELEEGKRVSWTVEYGKVTRAVSDVKGTSIAQMKSAIETSTEFINSLKKSKVKNPVCKIKPRVTAQSKGMTPSSGYKGVFTSIKEAEAAGKAISYLPSKDGFVYEIRRTNAGTFTTPVTGCELLSDVRAGYTPAPGIPLIPMDFMMQIIAFFRHFALCGGGNEALVNIYWDTHAKKFIIDTPEQVVSKVSIHSNTNPDLLCERYIHYMDIHSHNSMPAYFSPTDNEDEKATRLYTVIGRLDQYLPEIKTRLSNGGKYHEIDPSEVFEHIVLPFPDAWKEKVSVRAQRHDANKNGSISAAHGCSCGTDADSDIYSQLCHCPNCSKVGH